MTKALWILINNGFLTKLSLLNIKEGQRAQKLVLLTFVLVVSSVSLKANEILRVRDNYFKVELGNGICIFDSTLSFVKKIDLIKWIYNPIVYNNCFLGLAFNGVEYKGIIEIGEDLLPKLISLKDIGASSNYFEKMFSVGDSLYIYGNGILYKLNLKKEIITKKIILSKGAINDIYIWKSKLFIIDNDKIKIGDFYSTRINLKEYPIEYPNYSILGVIDQKLILKGHDFISSFNIETFKLSKEFKDISSHEELRLINSSIYSKYGSKLWIYGNNRKSFIPFQGFHYFYLRKNEIIYSEKDSLRKIHFCNIDSRHVVVKENLVNSFIINQSAQNSFWALNNNILELKKGDTLYVSKNNSWSGRIWSLRNNYTISPVNLEEKFPLFITKPFVFLFILSSFFGVFSSYYFTKFSCNVLLPSTVILTGLFIVFSLYLHLVTKRIILPIFLAVIVGALLGLIINSKQKYNSKELIFRIFQLSHGGNSFNNLFQIHRIIQNRYLYETDILNNKLENALNTYNKVTLVQIYTLLRLLPTKVGLVSISCYLSLVSNLIPKFYFFYKILKLDYFLEVIKILVEKVQKNLELLKERISYLNSIELGEAIKKLTSLFNELNINFETSNDVKFNRIIINEDDFIQVFTQLFQNSKQHNNFNDLSINIKVFYDNNRIKFLYKDSGKSIPNKIREKIYLPSTTTKPKGGFGMYEVQKLLNENLAQIEVEQNLNYKFRLIFRVAK